MFTGDRPEIAKDKKQYAVVKEHHTHFSTISIINMTKQVCYIMYYSPVIKNMFLSSYLYSILSYNHYKNILKFRLRNNHNSKR